MTPPFGKKKPSEHAEIPPSTEPTVKRRAMLAAGGPLAVGIGAIGLAAASTAPAEARPPQAAIVPEWHNVTDNAVTDRRVTGDGKSDDAAALRELIATVSSKSGSLYFPPGRYRLGSDLRLPASLTIILDNGAVLVPDKGVSVDVRAAVDAQSTKIFAGEGVITGDLNGERIVPQWWGAVGDGAHDDTAALQNALDLAKTNGGGWIFLPQGNYKITKGLKIYRNTQFTQHNASVMIRCHDSDFFLNGDSGATYPAYVGHGGIIIEGGTLDGNIVDYPDAFVAMSFGHADNLVIRDLTILDVSWGHAIEVNASRDVLIDNCRFLGFLPPADGSRDFSEAVQIDVPTRLSFGAFGAWDGTPSQSVTVRNCYFGSSGTKGTTSWACGVGTHGAIHDVWSRDIKIIDNTFDQLTYWAVRLFKWNDCIVRGNVFLNCGGAVAISTPAANTESTKDKDGVQQGVAQAGSRVHIIDNVIKGTSRYAAIGLYGRPDVYPTDTLILNNQVHDIVAQGSAIRVSMCRGVRIIGNVIKNAWRGIHPDDSDECDILDNVVEKIGVNGIEMNTSSAVRISGNTIRSCGFYGISLGAITGLIVERNLVESVSKNEEERYDGLLLTSACGPGQVRDNTVRQGSVPHRYGLQIVDSCQSIESSNNVLEGKTSPYRNDSATSSDQLHLYAPGGGRYRVQIDDNGTLSTELVTH